MENIKNEKYVTLLTLITTKQANGIYKIPYSKFRIYMQ